MQDMLLLASVAAAFIFGLFLMGKLDCFLESNRHMRESRPSSGEDTLRLGFCNPAAADGIADVLEQCSELYPDISVRIFSGPEDALLRGLSSGRFDVIFLPEDAVIPACMHCDSRMISLNYTPVMMKYGGLPIEPITDGHIVQKALWIGKASSAFAGCFIKCLKDKFSVSAQAK